jgi:hypothetical protein
MAREYDALRQDIWRLAQMEAADARRDEALQLRMEADVPWDWVERLWLLGGFFIAAWVGQRSACRRWRQWRQGVLAPADVETGSLPREEIEILEAPASERLENALGVEAVVPAASGWGAGLRGWLRGPQQVASEAVE